MSYTHLTEGERNIIGALRSCGFSRRRIASILERSPSTISRELHRNRSHRGKYESDRAGSYYRRRRRRNARPKKLTRPLWRMIRDLVRKNWSPEQISIRLRVKGIISISHETIYRAIWRNKAQGGNLWRHLRQSLKKRRKGYNTKDSRGRLSGKTLITERPPHIEHRDEPGHWEADTVAGRGSKHGIVTLVERMTGYTLIGKITARTVAQTNASISQLLMMNRDLPFETITFDNGTEFHGYAEIERTHGVKAYFAHPYHSWERGTNENTNGLIRQYMAKTKSMARRNQQYCDWVADQLNTRPRKRHEGKTPEEVMMELI